MARKTIFEFCEGDTLPLLQFEYENIDISSWAFSLHVATDSVPIVIPGTITNPYCGLFQFDLGGQLPAVGTWEAEIQTTDQNGEILTLKDFCVVVRAQIA